MLNNQRILLIISGGISAYKSPELIRKLRQAGARVRCILTSGGSEFVTPLTLASLSGDKVYSDLFSLNDESEMGHIRLSRETDLIVVAPASANILAQMSSGLSLDLATTTLLASNKPILVAPAMNSQMWQHPATQRNLEQLKIDGVHQVGPELGELACGETGLGRMAEIGCIIDAIEALLNKNKPLDGFKEIQPKVFAGLFPINSDDYKDFRDALEKLELNDSSFDYEPEVSKALGHGFRCGFLGMLHMEIIQERLEREYKLDLISTSPTVIYKVIQKNGNVIEVDNPSSLPDISSIEEIHEPIISASMLVPNDFIGNVITLCEQKRGKQIKITYVGGQALIEYYLPLNEVVLDFFDKLKSCTKGYASFDYYPIGYRTSVLAKLDILLNGDPVDALSALVHKTNSYALGKKLCAKLKELIPRQQFDIAIQSAIGAKIISRETVKALRKDVTAKCYGGDISRKRKLLEKQKKGKKRMRQVGNVEIPQNAFMAVLKLDD